MRLPDTAEIRFYTSTPGLAETYPVVPARKVIPDWWRNMPPEMTEPAAPGTPTSTARRCPGLLETLTMGWVLPLWMDIAIEEHDGQVTDIFTPPGGTPLAGHTLAMRPGMPMYHDEAHITIKLDGAWVVDTPPGYLLRFDPVPYAVDAPLIAVPGAYHGDILHQVNPVCRYRLQGDGRHVIEAGTPLAHLTVIRAADQRLTVSCRRDDARYEDLSWRGKGGIGVHGNRLIPNAYRQAVKTHQAAPASLGRSVRTLLARLRTRSPDA